MDSGRFAEILNAKVEGSGPPIILIHGLFSSLSNWDYLTPVLVEAGYRVIRLDLPGHGDSLKPDDPSFYRARTVFGFLDLWIAELQLEQSPILIGHSFGGYLSLRYILRNPAKVRGIILLDPFFRPDQLTPGLRIALRNPDIGKKAVQVASERIVLSMVGWDPANVSRFPSEVRQQIALDWKRASPHVFHIPKTFRTLVPKLPRILSPTMVIWGQKDLTLDPNSFLELVNCIPGSSGKAVPGVGHQPHLSEPQLVHSWILDYLEELPAISYS
jgi:pimeloyl-ACP methyl ester carboxylesterase